MKQHRLDPGWAWTKKFNLSAGVKIGDTIYTSGLVAFDSDGNVIGEDVYTQAKQTFQNIEELLSSAGATMADVIKINTFLTDISQYGEFGRARTEAFPAGVPASAAYATPALVMPALLVEVEAIAVVGSGI
jgi:enamine deaminase RidA (YjgF/YER057c/UK114 family)